MLDALGPHHDGSPLHVSNEAPALGQVVRVRLRVPPSWAKLTGVVVRSTPDREPHWDHAVLLGTVDGWDWWEAAVTVRNPRHGYRWMLQREDGSIRWLNQAGLHTVEPRDDDDFALLATPAAPGWLHDAVMYQVFPDRFARSAHADGRATPEWAIAASWGDPVDPVSPARSQQFYGGDLDGITDKLDHLVSLGVNLLYLTPFFPAGSNHRYDAASFDLVDPLLGGDDALIRLVEAAHARSIRVIGDLTTNHSGDRHEWFRAAFGNPGAPEAEYYYFTDEQNTQYTSWLGFPSLPKFDWSSRGLRRRFIEGRDSVVARWLEPPYSLDGWRIDVANMTGRLGETDLNAEVRRVLRQTMIDANPDTILLAEITNDATADLQGDGWHGAMTYPAFTRPVWGWLTQPSGEPYITAQGTASAQPWFFGQPVDAVPRYTARDVKAAITRFSSGIPWRVRRGNMLPLDSHDTGRFATHATPAAVAVALGLSLTLPGVPVVFAGDEFGEVGEDGELSRTPMPWGSEARPHVAVRLALYRALIAVRREHTALAIGGLRWLYVDDDAMVFVRETEEETVLVLASSADVDIDLVPGLVRGADAATSLVGDATLACADDGAVAVAADGPTFAVWALPGVAAP